MATTVSNRPVKLLVRLMSTGRKLPAADDMIEAEAGL